MMGKCFLKGIGKAAADASITTIVGTATGGIATLVMIGIGIATGIEL
jgi:hypothetical protein